MIICVCKCISDREIQSEIASGTTSFEGLQDSLGVGTQCGSCSCEIKDMLKDLKARAKNNNTEKSPVAIPRALACEFEASPQGQGVRNTN